MANEFLKNPLSLFDIRGKTAIVTGASGAFGALAAKTLAGAGANVVLAASKDDDLKKVAAECEKLGARTAGIALRPNSEENCDRIVRTAVDTFGGVDILVVAGGLNKVSKIVDQKVEDFLDVMDANVNQSWLMARAAGRARRQGGPDLVGARPARPSGRLQRLLRLEVGGRRHHQGARLRVGRERHHRERAGAHRLPLAADSLDV